MIRDLPRIFTSNLCVFGVLVSITAFPSLARTARKDALKEARILSSFGIPDDSDSEEKKTQFREHLAALRAAVAEMHDDGASEKDQKPFNDVLAGITNYRIAETKTKIAEGNLQHCQLTCENENLRDNYSVGRSVESTKDVAGCQVKCEDWKKAIEYYRDKAAKASLEVQTAFANLNAVPASRTPARPHR